MIIQTQALSKTYGKSNLIGPIDITVAQGEIFGLLGPNAAGKSTIIRMLAGVIQASAGSADILGLNLLSDTNAIKRQIGYVSQHFGLYADLSVLENIRFYASLYGIRDEQKFERLLQKYSLEHFRDKKAGQLSGGYQRRLSLVCALVHDPKLVFLDEPTAGIDPVTRKRIWDLFYTLVNEGKTLFVTTHYMEEAERCSKIVFLSHGKVIAEGTPRSIKSALPDYDIYALTQSFDHDMLTFLDAQENVILINQLGNELRIMVRQSLQKDELKRLMQPYVTDDIILKDTQVNLEDVFIALTQDDKR